MAFDLFSSKKNITENKTYYDDSSANAGGDNSIAVGVGANLSIQTSDPETFSKATAYAAANDRENTTRYLATLNTLTTDRVLSSQAQDELKASILKQYSGMASDSALRESAPMYAQPQEAASGIDNKTLIISVVVVGAVLVFGFMRTK